MGITDKISHAAERKAFETIPDGKWAHYTQRLIRENDPYILKTFLTNAAYEGGFRGYQTALETAEKYDINVPWLILMDPTSACNMHCTGCWAAEYGHKQSLTFEEMDRVLTEAKALGTHACLFTGGEPLLRKKRRHPPVRKAPGHGVPRLHQRHPHRRGVLPGEAAGGQLLRVHQRREL